ncbi:MAG: hypothetical protein IPG66_11815 [Hydrogenophilales bacterium]|nr:hypothetical protein [Hydrogenophilales bacterium]
MRLITRIDIEAAIRWRFDGIPEDELASMMISARQLFETHEGEITDSAPAVAALLEQLARSGDRRSPWSLLCALLWRVADGLTASSAGFEVAVAWQSSRRSRSPRRREELTEWMIEFASHNPNATPADIWRHGRILAHDEYPPFRNSPEVDAIRYMRGDTEKRITFKSFTRRAARVLEKAGQQRPDVQIDDRFVA